VIRALRRYVIKKRFARMVADFDRRIAEAQQKHKPVRPIMEEKRAFLHAALRGRS
jgi:hypothetical protein